ncbi:hypothetical protein ETAA8_40350 [Anatilimnocola aggregata]|uniref:Uncharacterized protein n=1 Tax=Anatilimnocola aggregata TaxID=2528021 RepID=A0A517YFD0_9BACT|nr:hypothetical protein ETAA8_40350 [Anatilimnocola aggregata]
MQHLTLATISYGRLLDRRASRYNMVIHSKSGIPLPTGSAEANSGLTPPAEITHSTEYNRSFSSGESDALSARF